MSKKALMYGGGNIGRGFIAQLFNLSGYEVVFIDVVDALVEKVNTDKEYPIYITNGDSYDKYTVNNVRAVNGKDEAAVAEEIATALRYWVAMVSQYVITTVDCATIEAYRTQGVTEVVWVSVKDKSRCVVCKQRDGKVYPIDNIPPKPHIGCRCYFLPKGR